MKKKLVQQGLCVLLGMIMLAACKPSSTHETEKNERWPAEKANAWYKQQGWLIGANFAPSSAINQLEMWQADTFDPETIDRELGWAEDLGFNTMRVFLHHIPWQQDSAAFIQRIDTYLGLADKHHIRTMLVLLDDVWNPYPVAGKQPAPKPHVHNSGWVQSPGREILEDSSRHEELKGYIKGIISHFKEDKRVIIWDLYNEPGNPNKSSYGDQEPADKEVHSLSLMKKVYYWAREVNPSQPLCIDVWTAVTKELSEMSDIDRFAFENSDVINFHCYADSAVTEKMVERLATSGRPLICTEYMARPVGSTFQAILPVFRKHQVAAYNWGFVSGKSQTIYPWESWKKSFSAEPELWFHDIFRQDGTSYKKEETDFIKSQTGKL